MRISANWVQVAPYGWLEEDGQTRLLLDPSLPGFGSARGTIPRAGGCWVYAGAPGVALRLTPPSGPASGRAAGVVSNRNWTAMVVAEHAAGGRAQAVIGVSQKVLEPLSLRYPPSLDPNGLALAFEEPVTGRRTAGEVRPGLDGTVIWRMVVTSPDSGQVTVSWPGLLRQLPANLVFRLTDLSTNQTILMNTRAAFRYTATRAGEERLFDLAVAFERLDRTQIQSLVAVPGRGRTVALTLTLSGPAELRLAIFGLGGRLVRELASQAAAGATSLAWDGRDQQGRAVPAGSYVLQATAVSPNGTVTRATRTILVR